MTINDVIYSLKQYSISRDENYLLSLMDKALSAEEQDIRMRYEMLNNIYDCKLYKLILLHKNVLDIALTSAEQVLNDCYSGNPTKSSIKHEIDNIIRIKERLQHELNEFSHCEKCYKEKQ